MQMLARAVSVETGPLAVLALASPRATVAWPRYRCRMRLALLGVVAAALAGCAPTPPPRWAQGGAVLALPAARWDRADGEVLEIRRDGHVYENGSLLYVVDRVGRVVDEDYEPVALLFPD